ncbi:protein cueball-like isoform X1 [Gigantopelta aegis]|uniref:protein cueball-like isoform X1 n=1 Tax=Gigantopelta aegis TaxID=1735272 RepID=UPI001B88C4E2|nr:protein cueball-like isoform X1 [Gigantopelta aegis]XP_041360534.1 protein cueball-like isoform X1 [Gigantopelta aegis]
MTLLKLYTIMAVTAVIFFTSRDVAEGAHLDMRLMVSNSSMNQPVIFSCALIKGYPGSRDMNMSFYFGRVHGERTLYGNVDRERHNCSTEMHMPGYSILCGRGSRGRYDRNETKYIFVIHSLQKQDLQSPWFCCLYNCYLNSGEVYVQLAKKCMVHCLHGGTPSKTKRCACDCPDYWTGYKCQKCSLKSCANKGRLKRSVCSCVCPDHWTGITCENCELQCGDGYNFRNSTCLCEKENVDDGGLNIGVIAGIVIGLILLLLIIVTCIILCKRRQRKAKEAKEAEETEETYKTETMESTNKETKYTKNHKRPKRTKHARQAKHAKHH